MNIYFSSHAATLSFDMLAKNKQWLKLIHDKNDNRFQNSYITSESFFLTKKSPYNAKSELIATFNSFYEPNEKVSNINKHPQCLFPARLQFIRKHVDFSILKPLPKISCPKFKKWRNDINAKSISIMFASGYMSNPASMYGHLLLKINKKSPNANNLLNYSLNYGAIVPDNENPVIYVAKGIMGGYQAAYSDKQFYRHQHNYSDIELRDMWEYQLKLSQADVDLLIAHIWELLDKQFNYYFIDENCAFHIAKLLELVLDQPLINNDSLWVLPSAVAQGLMETSYSSKPLVSAIHYHPSRESVLHQRYHELSKYLQNIASQIIAKNFNFSLHQYQQLSIKNQKQVIEALILYFEGLKQKSADDSIIEHIKKRLIKARLALPIGTSKKVKVKYNIAPPHQAMKVSKFSGGYTNIGHQDYANIGFRMTYFDLLSSSVAHNKHTNLEMLDIELLSTAHSTKIYKFDLIDIKSFYSPSIPWDKNNNTAWGVRAGYQQLYNNCLNCGIYQLEGEWGKSTKLNNHLVYALLGAQAFTGEANDVVLSAKIGIIASLNQQLTAQVEIKQQSPINSTDIKKTLVNIEINYQVYKNIELRLFAEQQQEKLLGIKINYFWGF